VTTAATTAAWVAAASASTVGAETNTSSNGAATPDMHAVETHATSADASIKVLRLCVLLERYARYHPPPPLPSHPLT
jgi:hypothetical protein